VRSSNVDSRKYKIVLYSRVSIAISMSSLHPDFILSALPDAISLQRAFFWTRLPTWG